MAEAYEASHEPLDVLDIPNLAYLGDGQDLVKICFNAAFGDDVPKELASVDPKCALFWVHPDAEMPEVGEGFFQVNDETTALPDLYNDVVNVDL
jgi:hypothetical protein